MSACATLAWLAQAGQALDRAHAQGIVHRDVKPANLLLDRDGSVNVSDFGIASTTGLDTLTLPGTVLGTAGYLSPEQARGESATPASDRYALGVVAFELLTGRRPFEGDTAATEAFAHVTAPVPSAERIEPGLPDGVDDVLVRALAKDPADRPDSCAALVAELEDAFERASAPTRVAAAPAAVAPRVAQSTRPLPPAAGRPRRSGPRYRRLALVAVGLLVAGLVLAGFSAHFENGMRRVAALARRRRRPSRARRAPRRPSPARRPTTTTEPPPADERLQRPGRAERPGIRPHAGRGIRTCASAPRPAVAALGGTGSITEAYASYNLAFTRFALGRCDGVLALLDRSEAVRASGGRSTRFAASGRSLHRGDETASEARARQGPRRGRQTTEASALRQLRDDLVVLGEAALAPASRRSAVRPRGRRTGTSFRVSPSR